MCTMCDLKWNDVGCKLIFIGLQDKLPFCIEINFIFTALSYQKKQGIESKQSSQHEQKTNSVK